MLNKFSFFGEQKAKRLEAGQLSKSLIMLFGVFCLVLSSLFFKSTEFIENNLEENRNGTGRSQQQEANWTSPWDR